jgi:hypothetical protein
MAKGERLLFAGIAVAASTGVKVAHYVVTRRDVPAVAALFVALASATATLISCVAVVSLLGH